MFGNLTFWVLSAVFALLDVVAAKHADTRIGKILLSQKRQGSKGLLSSQEQFECFLVAALNMGVLAPLVCLFMEPLWASGMGGM